MIMGRKEVTRWLEEHYTSQVLHEFHYRRNPMCCTSNHHTTTTTTSTATTTITKRWKVYNETNERNIYTYHLYFALHLGLSMCHSVYVSVQVYTVNQNNNNSNDNNRNGNGSRIEKIEEGSVATKSLGLMGIWFQPLSHLFLIFYQGNQAPHKLVYTCTVGMYVNKFQISLRDFIRQDFQFKFFVPFFFLSL